LRTDADFDAKAASASARVCGSDARKGPSKEPRPLPHICLGRALPWHRVAGDLTSSVGGYATR